MSDKAILEFFAKVIEDKLGIVFSDHNYFQLEMRLLEISKKLNFCSVGEFYRKALIGLDPTEMKLLLDLSTNNETSFFRDQKVFEAFEFVLNLGESNHLSIWSCGCSNGKEAYSIAMTINEFNEKLKKGLTYNLLASDVSDRVIEIGKRGRYTQLEVNRGLNSNFLSKYFNKMDGNQWEIHSKYKQNIEWKNLNLLQPNYGLSQKFDVVFLRNVLIYQKVESKIKILSKVKCCLKPQGYLILGSGESLIGLSTDFKPVKVGDSIFYQVK